MCHQFRAFANPAIENARDPRDCPRCGVNGKGSPHLARNNSLKFETPEKIGLRLFRRGKKAGFGAAPRLACSTKLLQS